MLPASHMVKFKMESLAKLTCVTQKLPAPDRQVGVQGQPWKIVFPLCLYGLWHDLNV